MTNPWPKCPLRRKFNFPQGKIPAEFKKLLSDYLKNKPAKSDKGGDETSKEKQDMSLTSKQRAQLMSMASKEDTIVHIGKGGINENVIKQVEDAPRRGS